MPRSALLSTRLVTLIETTAGETWAKISAKDIGAPGGGAKVAMLIAAALVMVGLFRIDAKFWGVVVMGSSVVILFFMPWLDRSPVKSIRYRPGWHKAVYGVFVVTFLVLGYLGIQPPDPVKNIVSQVGTVLYFSFFLLMPWWSQLGSFKPVPDRVVFHAH